jgi:hypothetical protein
MSEHKAKEADLGRTPRRLRCVREDIVTLLLTGAALLLLFGSYLVVRVLIDADAAEPAPRALPMAQRNDARQHRRAA